MLLDFGYWDKFVMLYFFFFFLKAENNWLKKASWPKFCNIIFLFLLKIELVRPLDQQVNLVSSFKRIFLSKNSIKDVAWKLAAGSFYFQRILYKMHAITYLTYVARYNNLIFQ